MKVLDFGSLNIDYVYSVDHAVVTGETLACTERNIFCGGKGLNQAIALAKAGVPVYMAGQIGEDGGVLTDACHAAGINTEFIRVVPGGTGHTIIQVNKEGDNCILLYGGANRSLTREYIDEVLSHFDKGDILVLQNEVNNLDYIIEKGYERGMQIVLNPSPFDDNLKNCDFGKVSMLQINEIEGRQITGEEDTGKILAKLRELYPDTKVVLTLGSVGSVYQYGNTIVRQGIYPVKAVDTTAAGDTFTGYFVASMMEELPVEKGLDLAARAAAITVTRQGATASIPERAEVEAWVFD